MSNTLEEIESKVIDVINKAKEASRATDGLADDKFRAYHTVLVEEMSHLILSQAHKIGLEAIGPNYIDLEDDTDPHTDITLKWMNFEKGQERARLSKITGVKE